MQPAYFFNGLLAQRRYTQIDIEATPFYHCISRCVRRAFLCGYDRFSDRSFDHRMEWIVEKLADLGNKSSLPIIPSAVILSG